MTRSRYRFFFFSFHGCVLLLAPQIIGPWAGAGSTGERRLERGQEDEQAAVHPPGTAGKSGRGGRRDSPHPHGAAPGPGEALVEPSSLPPALAARAGTHHRDSRSHSWSRAKSKLSMVGGVGVSAAAAAEARAARALQRKTALKVHPSSAGAAAAAARPPHHPPHLGRAPLPPPPDARRLGSSGHTHPLAGSRAGTLGRAASSPRRRRACPSSSPPHRGPARCPRRCAPRRPPPLSPEGGACARARPRRAHPEPRAAPRPPARPCTPRAAPWGPAAPAGRAALLPAPLAPAGHSAVLGRLGRPCQCGGGSGGGAGRGMLSALPSAPPAARPGPPAPPGLHALVWGPGSTLTLLGSPAAGRLLTWSRCQEIRDTPGP